MNLKFDMSKPYFDEIKDCNAQIKKQLKKNRKNEYINEIQNSIGSNKDILEQFPVFFKKVLFPITYERFFGKEQKSTNGWNNSTPAISKWFGTKGWKNIGTFHDNQLIASLTQEHINLIPDPDKKKIAQDFFDYSRVFVLDEDKGNKENEVVVPMHVNTKLYDFNWVQIRDMNKKYNSYNSYYNSNVEDDDFTNYIYPKATVDGIVDQGEIEYNATENTIKVLFFREHTKEIVEEIFVSRKTIDNNKDEDENDINLFLSDKLMNWNHYSRYFKGKFHEMFLDDIENLLTPEIKKAVNMFIAKQATIKNDWIALQEKYAKNLLLKGNI